MHLAERGLYTVTQNNPRVGCLLVKEGLVIGRGWHRGDGGKHAEIEALDDAGDAAQGATAYVTLEPCCWEGRTPACSKTLTERGIASVVVGSRDPHPKVNGRGISSLENSGIEVRELDLPQLESLNPGQRKRVKQNLPWVRIKSAVSFDGRTAMADGESKWITGTASRDDVQQWRARSGAILTGIGTILADDPRLSVRSTKYPHSTPTRIVLDTHAQISCTARLFREEGKVVIVCGKGAETHGLEQLATIWEQPTESIMIKTVLQQIASEGINEVLVEAGAKLMGSFLKESLWDELILYVAPKYMGDSARPFANYEISQMAETVGARVDSVCRFDADTRFVFVRQ